MMDNQKKSVDRLPYAKPRLRIITLVAEEVLAINCKQATGAGMVKNGKGCGHPSCRAAGGS
jgi:hypothetical protein